MRNPSLKPIPRKKKRAMKMKSFIGICWTSLILHQNLIEEVIGSLIFLWLSQQRDYNSNNSIKK